LITSLIISLIIVLIMFLPIGCPISLCVLCVRASAALMRSLIEPRERHRLRSDAFPRTERRRGSVRTRCRGWTMKLGDINSFASGSWLIGMLWCGRFFGDGVIGGLRRALHFPWNARHFLAACRPNGIIECARKFAPKRIEFCPHRGCISSCDASFIQHALKPLRTSNLGCADQMLCLCRESPEQFAHFVATPLTFTHQAL
jgi:hypothetical protein